MAAAAYPSQSRLLGLPAELRLAIYDQVFNHSRTIDLLLRDAPNTALRATCKFIYAESAASYNKAVRRYPDNRADLVEELITKYETTPASSPHRSIVFNPPISRAATLLRSVNSHCLHACAKDGCFMCEDKAHKACFDCGRNVAVALWCYDNPRDTPALVVRGHQGEKLTPLGEFVLANRPVAQRRIKNRVDQSKVDRWWQRELDVQRAIEYRCELRRTTVEAYWAASTSLPFQADVIAAMEEQDGGMAEFNRVASLHGEEGFLDWEPEYERRAAQRVIAAAASAQALPQQIPAKRDAEKIKALQARFKVTTPVGRYNTRVRGGRVETHSRSPLHERRAKGRWGDAPCGMTLPSFNLVIGSPAAMEIMAAA